MNRGDWQGCCAADALHPSGMTAAHVSNLCNHSVHRQCCANLRCPHRGRSSACRPHLEHLVLAPHAAHVGSRRGGGDARQCRSGILRRRSNAMKDMHLDGSNQIWQAPAALYPTRQHVICQPLPTCMAVHTCSNSRRHCGSSPTASARDRRNRPSSKLAAPAIQAANRKAPDCGQVGSSRQLRLARIKPSVLVGHRVEAFQGRQSGQQTSKPAGHMLGTCRMSVGASTPATSQRSSGTAAMQSAAPYRQSAMAAAWEVHRSVLQEGTALRGRARSMLIA